MHTIFLARFVGSCSEFQGFSANFSTSKKVIAFQSCLRKIGIRPILLVTHVGEITVRATTVRKIGDCICIIPALSTHVQNRILKYLYGICFTTIMVCKLRKRLRVSLFISWDYLPDTLLPLLLQGRRTLSRTIVDIEESIGADPRAGSIFKAFEYFVVRYFRLRAIGNNVSTAKSLGLELEGIFPGFFASSLTEEQHLLQRVERKKFSDETVVLFSGRIDTVRGASQFVELARCFEEHADIRFVMTGYGNTDELAEISRIAPKNLSFRPGLTRSEYLDFLFDSDIAFNYISDAEFIFNSFPSKVVEYLLGTVVIVSNHPIDIGSKRLVVREDLADIKAFITEYHEDRNNWRASYSPEIIKRELIPFSISHSATNLSRLFNA
jgi:hypothetical protein